MQPTAKISFVIIATLFLSSILTAEEKNIQNSGIKNSDLPESRIANFNVPKYASIYPHNYEQRSYLKELHNNRKTSIGRQPLHPKNQYGNSYKNQQKFSLLKRRVQQPSNFPRRTNQQMSSTRRRPSPYNRRTSPVPNRYNRRNPYQSNRYNRRKPSHPNNYRRRPQPVINPIHSSRPPIRKNFHRPPPYNQKRPAPLSSDHSYKGATGFSPAKLNKLFELKSSLTNAQELYDDAKSTVDNFGGDQDTLYNLVEEAKEELGSFKAHCLGLHSIHGEDTVVGEIIGNKCYSIHNMDFINFEKARHSCQARGGKLAVPDVTPESTWGQDIYDKFSDVLDPLVQGPQEVWLDGFPDDNGNMVLTSLGYKIPGDSTFWFSNNLGVRSAPPDFIDLPYDALTLTNDNLSSDAWYISSEDSENYAYHLCEYEVVYVEEEEEEEEEP